MTEGDSDPRSDDYKRSVKGYRLTALAIVILAISNAFSFVLSVVLNIIWESQRDGETIFNMTQAISLGGGIVSFILQIIFFLILGIGIFHLLKGKSQFGSEHGDNLKMAVIFVVIAFILQIPVAFVLNFFGGLAFGMFFPYELGFSFVLGGVSFISSSVWSIASVMLILSLLLISKESAGKKSWRMMSIYATLGISLIILRIFLSFISTLFPQSYIVVDYIITGISLLDIGALILAIYALFSISEGGISTEKRAEKGLNRLLRRGLSKPVRSLSIILIPILFLSLINGISLGIQHNSFWNDPYGGGDENYVNWKKDVESYSASEFLEEGEEYVIDYSGPGYITAVSASVEWDDEFDTLLMENKPDTFRLVIEAFSGEIHEPSDSVEIEGENDQGGLGFVSEQMYFDPSSEGEQISVVNIRVIMVDAGNYEGKRGPSLLEREDVGNNFDLLVFIEYRYQDTDGDEVN